MSALGRYLTADSPREADSRPARNNAMDALRGLAVFGIFLVNLPLLTAPPAAFFEWRENLLWTESADRLILALIAIFAQGKFYTIFSFLFGLGVGLQIVRAQRWGDEEFPERHRRRMFALLAIGLVHLFGFWWGDVLHLYALLGLLLLTFADAPPRTLLTAGLALSLFPLPMTVLGPRAPSASMEPTEYTAHIEKLRNRAAIEIAAYSQGGPGAAFEQRSAEIRRRTVVEISWSIELFGSMLLGFWAARRGIFADPSAHQKLLKTLGFATLPLALGGTAAQVAYLFSHPVGPLSSPAHVAAMFREFLLRPAMAYGFAALLLLLPWQAALVPLAAVGRLALTNYLLHTLVFTTVANGYGLGAYGGIRPVAMLGIFAGVFALQLAGSVWWTRRYALGPAEWAWRSLAAGRALPFAAAATGDRAG